jgi:hypothetical protein
MSVPKDYRPSEVQSEMNEVWASENPELFVNAVFKFAKEYQSTDFNHGVDFTRNGYVTLVAKRK